jgi:murein endopeptidase
MDSSGDGYYTYEDSGWLKYGQPSVVAVFQQFASDWNITHPNNSIGVGDLSQFGGAGNFARHPAGGHPGGAGRSLLRPVGHAGWTILARL